MYEGILKSESENKSKVHWTYDLVCKLEFDLELNKVAFYLLCTFVKGKMVVTYQSCHIVYILLYKNKKPGL